MMRSIYVINFTIGYEKAKVVSLATALARVGFCIDIATLVDYRCKLS